MISRRWHARLLDILTYGLLCLGCMAALTPILWGLLTSLKKEINVAVYPPQWLPHPATVEHYVDLLTSGNVLRFFLNSLVLAVGTILLGLVVASPGAYAAARFQFRGKNTILMTILVTSMIPGISILIPIFLVAIRADLLNNYAFMILVYGAWLVPQAIWFIKGFIEVVPRDLEEAALLDGCSLIGAFWRITLPLIQPGLAAVAILFFVFVWNDFLIGAVLTNREEMRTVQVGLLRSMQDIGIFWGQFMTYAMLATAPILFAFFVLQKRFIEGLTRGGVKG
ncbi:MAG: carbohydrate ABC transporter permease [Casimicrobiaceae bacterium]